LPGADWRCLRSYFTFQPLLLLAKQEEEEREALAAQQVASISKLEGIVPQQATNSGLERQYADAITDSKALEAELGSCNSKTDVLKADLKRYDFMLSEASIALTKTQEWLSKTKEELRVSTSQRGFLEVTHAALAQAEATQRSKVGFLKSGSEHFAQMVSWSEAQSTHVRAVLAISNEHAAALREQLADLRQRNKEHADARVGG
jgi:chromosome segregation ATPase